MRDSKLHIDGTDFDKLIDMHNAEYVEEVKDIDEVRNYLKTDGWEEIRYKWKDTRRVDKVAYVTYTNEDMIKAFDELVVNSTGYDIKDDLVMGQAIASMAQKENK